MHINDGEKCLNLVFESMATHTYGLHKRIVEWEAELLFDEKGE